MVQRCYPVHMPNGVSGRLVCKICVFERNRAKLLPEIDKQPRYNTPSELLEHLNTVHYANNPVQVSWPLWPGLVEECRRLHYGFHICCADAECTHYELWCLWCNYSTTDPILASSPPERCPSCGHEFEPNRTN